ncbi:hypothetical protein A2U01_0085645, partial [Trifolium medium]|nr:hypothetical protein [Trifolium medium]
KKHCHPYSGSVDYSYPAGTSSSSLDVAELGIVDVGASYAATY